MRIGACPFGWWTRGALLLGAIASAGLGGSSATGATRGAGLHLLFSSDRTGTSRLYGVNADGSGLADLGAPASVLLRDGRMLLSEPGRIVRVSADGRHRRTLGSGEPLAVSPDGRQIAFLNIDNSGDEVIGTVDLDGSHRRVLVRSPQQIGLVGWLPDSSSMLIARPDPNHVPSRDRLLRVDVRAAGRARTVLRGSFDEPVVSARGLVAFTRFGAAGGRQSLLVLDPTRPNVTSVVATAWRLVSPQWSPDGRRLAFVRENAASEARLVIASGGRATTLLTSTHYIYFGAWSPGGDALAAVVGYDSGPQLVVVGADGRVQARVRSKNIGLVLHWSPDGALIAFARGDLFVVRRDGSGLRKLTSDGNNEFFGWARGSVPQTARRAAPLPATETIAGLTLRSRGRVDELAADGPWVAAIIGRTRRDCAHVVAWRAGATRGTRFSAPRPCSGNEETLGLALTGAGVKWSSYYCGNECYLLPFSANTGRPGIATAGQENPLGSNAPAPTRPPPPAETHNGVAFSMPPGLIRLRRVADSREITIQPPGRLVDAELEDAGLFYAYNVGQGPMPGRVTFIPFSELARRF
jgi:Tol biopolymer transport system component